MKKGYIAFCKKILTGALATSILAYGLIICDAATIEDIDINSGIIEISGSVNGDGMVLVEVLKGNSAQTNYLSNLIYIYQKNAENEKYEFEFDILNAGNGQTGEYTVRVSDFSGLTETGKFYFYTEDEINPLREEINLHIQNTERDIADISWLTDYFIANKNKLIPSYIPFDTVVANGYISGFAELYSYEKMSPDNRTMKESIRKISLITMIGNLSGGDIYDLLESYGDDLKISDKQSYITYTEFEENVKKSATDMLSGLARPYGTESAFVKAFDTAVMITKLRQINGTTACENVLSGYPEYFTLSNATTEHYKEILQGITNNTVSSIDDIKIILNKTYNNPDVTEDNVNTGMNSGTSGGSGGFGGGETLKGPASNGAEGTDGNSIVAGTIKEFKDLEGFEWAAESIRYLRDKGVINGYSDELFAPSDNVTRAQLCKMLCLALEINSYKKNELVFSDVGKDEWYYDYVVTLSSLGIVNGTGDNLFESDKNVTREDMAVMVYRALKLKNTSLTGNGETKFNDKAQISEYAMEAVSFLNGNKILNGDDKGNFNPKDSANRAETAKFIHSVCLKYGGVK